MPRNKSINIYKYKQQHGWGGAYCLGFLGALIYYLQTSTGFWASVLAILKAIVWPAFLVHKMLGL